MGVVGFFVVVAFFVGIAAAIYSQGAQNRASVLERVLPLVAEGRLEAQGVRSHVLYGRVGEREVQIKVGYRPSLSGPARYPVSSHLALSHGHSISLRVRRDAGLAALEKLAGRARDVEVSGGDAFDRKHLVEAPTDFDRSGLAAKEVRDAISRLLTIWKLSEVQVEGRWVSILGDTTHLDRRLFRDLLETLDMLAHAYDRSPVGDLSVKPLFAWTGGEDCKARCPFCHDRLVDDENQVGSCTGCGTLIHTTCHAELGRCAIIGCASVEIAPQGPIPFSGLLA